MSTKTKRLRQARRIRSAIASEFDALKSGQIELISVLEDPQSFSLAHCDVWDVLRRAPHLGRAGAKKILMTARVWPHDKLGKLSPMDREELIKCLPPRAKSKR